MNTHGILLSVVLLTCADALHAADPERKIVPPEKFFGSIWQNQANENDDRYFGTLFDQITPERCGKLKEAEAKLGEFKWEPITAMYEYGKSHHLKIKQHNFVWGGKYQPDWISPDNAREALTKWMTLFSEKYSDMTDYIDVVNEPLHEDPTYRSALTIEGNKKTDNDWVIWAYKAARQQFPHSKLLINDYNILTNEALLTRYIALAKLLKDRGLLDGIADQGHNLEKADPKTIKASLDQLASVGLPIYISEYEVQAASEEEQLRIYKAQFPIFWEHPAVSGVTLWGFREGKMWRKNAYLVRSDGSERPALVWLRSYLSAHGRPSASQK